MPRHLARRSIFSARTHSNRPGTDHMDLRHATTMRWEDGTSNNAINHLNPWSIATQTVVQVPWSVVLPPLRERYLNQFLPKPSTTKERISVYVLTWIAGEMIKPKTRGRKNVQVVLSGSCQGAFLELLLIGRSDTTRYRHQKCQRQHEFGKLLSSEGRA